MEKKTWGEKRENKERKLTYVDDANESKSFVVAMSGLTLNSKKVFRHKSFLPFRTNHVVHHTDSREIMAISKDNNTTCFKFPIRHKVSSLSVEK